MVARSRRIHSGLADEMIHAATEQFIPAGVAGALLTVVLFRFAPESLWMLPGLWQIVFSLGVFASCRSLPRPMFAVGVWYLAAGLASLALANGGARVLALGHGGAVRRRAAPHGRRSLSRRRRAPMPKPDPKHEQAGRFAYDGLDRVIHEKARLSVLTSLVAHPKGLVFGDLKQMCGLTDGNLSRHLQVLEEAGLIEIVKGYDHNRPQTVVPHHAARAPALSRLSERCWSRWCAMRPSAAKAGARAAEPASA